MTKAKRMMNDSMKLIDCIVELLDARAPISSQNPDLPKIANGKPRLILMTKMDLADPSKTDQWIEYFKKQGITALPINARDGQNMKKVVPLIHEVCKERIERNKRRGLVNKPLRLMVAGIPNVGKSTFINKLVGKASTKTGDKPGVTKGKQWIKIKKGLELLDTPGILWPKFEDQKVGLHLAYIGSINDNILDTTELCYELIEHLMNYYPNMLPQHYEQVEFEKEGQRKPSYEIMEGITKQRNFLKEGSKPDLLRMSQVMLDEFRGGKYGRCSVDVLSDMVTEE
jgi:ribosome biogenesis GTPase A